MAVGFSWQVRVVADFTEEQMSEVNERIAKAMEECGATYVGVASFKDGWSFGENVSRIVEENKKEA